MVTVDRKYLIYLDGDEYKICPMDSIHMIDPESIVEKDIKSFRDAYYKLGDYNWNRIRKRAMEL